MIKVSSKIKLNFPKIKQLSKAQVTALEQTAELYILRWSRHRLFLLLLVIFRMRALLLIILRATGAKYHWFPVRHMQEGCIFIRNIISQRMRTRMQKESGMRAGFPAGKIRISPSMHIKRSTGG